MKEYTCRVTLVFCGHHHEAKSKKEYINIIKEQYLDDYNLTINETEITEVHSNGKK